MFFSRLGPKWLRFSLWLPFDTKQKGHLSSPQTKTSHTTQGCLFILGKCPFWKDFKNKGYHLQKEKAPKTPKMEVVPLKQPKTKGTTSRKKRHPRHPKMEDVSLTQPQKPGTTSQKTDTRATVGWLVFNDAPRRAAGRRWASLSSGAPRPGA